VDSDGKAEPGNAKGEPALAATGDEEETERQQESVGDDRAVDEAKQGEDLVGVRKLETYQRTDD
jgi:hypothetical protein